MRISCLPYLFLGACLTACAAQQTTPSDIDPDLVLSRAAEAAQTLDSAQYLLNGNFRIQSQLRRAEGTVRIDGTLQDAGKKMRLQTEASLAVKEPQESYSLDGSLDVVVLSDTETYMRINSLVSQPDSSLFRPELVAALYGTWWQLPQGEAPTVAGTVTPDRRLLRAQAQVVSVTKDLGMQDVNGRRTYVYNVQLDPEKLVAYMAERAADSGKQFNAAQGMEIVNDISASGTLWIDAENYYLQKLHWDVESFPLEQSGTLSADFELTFRNFNAAPPVLAPASPERFSPEILLTLPASF